MTYAAVVAADSPVAWWKLNEASGSSFVDSGSGTAANLNLTGSNLLYSQEGLDGLDAGGGTSIFWGGTNAYMSIGSLPSKLQFASASNFTIEAWVAIDPVKTSPGAAVVTESYSGDGNVRYMLGFSDGNAQTRKPSFGWYNGTWRLVQSPDSLDDGSWHHLVGTYDGGANQLELWVDGVSKGTLTPGGVQPTGTESFYVARRWDNGNDQFFTGWVDEVAMYNTKLTSTRISAHFAALNPPAAEMRTTMVGTDAVVTGSTPEIRLTEIFAESVIVDSTPGISLTQTFIEAVVEYVAPPIPDPVPASAVSAGARAKWERINWW